MSTIVNFCLSANYTNLFHSHIKLTTLTDVVNIENDKITMWFYIRQTFLNY